MAGIKGFGRSSDYCALGQECDDKPRAWGRERELKKNISAASNDGQAAKSTQTIGYVLGTSSPGRKSGQNSEKEGKKTLARKPKARERSLYLGSALLYKVITSRHSPCRL